MDVLSAMATFLRVVETGSLSRTARELGITTAAISRQMTALEAELGAALLVRTTRRVAPTEAGRRFYEGAERTVREAEDARASVRGDRTVTGLVSASVSTALGLSLLDVALARLVRDHPGLRVDLRVEDQPVDLIGEGVDVAVRAGLLPPDTTTLVAQPLGRAERVAVASAAYLKTRGEPAHPSDLRDHDCLVLLHAGAGVGVWRFHQGGQSLAVEVKGAYRANALHALRGAAIEGLGVALLPWFLVAPDVGARRLRVLRLGGWAPAAQDVHALVRADARDRARVRTLLAHIKTALEAALGERPPSR